MSNLLDPTGLLAMVGTPQLPRAYNRDLNNFAPRIGFAWSVRPHTVVRAAYGVYYDYIPLHLAQANFTNSAGIGANPVGPQAIVPLDFDQNAYNGTAPGAPVFTLPGGTARSAQHLHHRSQPANSLRAELESEHSATNWQLISAWKPATSAAKAPNSFAFTI